MAGNKNATIRLHKVRTMAQQRFPMDLEMTGAICTGNIGGIFSDDDLLTPQADMKLGRPSAPTKVQ
jgi:hypothetical protein